MLEQQTLNIKVKDNPLISSDIFFNAEAFFICVCECVVKFQGNDIWILESF